MTELMQLVIVCVKFDLYSIKGYLHSGLFYLSNRIDCLKYL